MIKQIVKILNNLLPLDRNLSPKQKMSIALAIADIDPWTSVEDGLPEDGEYVNVYPPYTSTVFDDEPRHVLKYDSKYHTWKYYLGGSVHTVLNPFSITHWLKITPPKGGKK